MSIASFYTRFARSLLFAMPPEAAHKATILALRASNHLPLPTTKYDARLTVDAFGLNFPNPLGMAAGFDKNAEVPDALLHLGFGFVEIGTVPPRPQPGNPSPRVFRLKEDNALINRLGFNSEGQPPVLERLKKRAGKSGIVGVNIGANKESHNRIQDYVSGITCFYDVASYFTINISSPNTPGLRDLQHEKQLRELISRCLEARETCQQKDGIVKPILVKIAPDLTEQELDNIVAVARQTRIDGMIVSNTTLDRPDTLRAHEKSESGGLSGAPLFQKSTRCLAQTYQRVEGQFPLIGVGGIDSPQAALAKIEAGAHLLQLYSALAYQGPCLIHQILEGFTQAMDAQQIGSISDLVGCKAAEWAA